MSAETQRDQAITILDSNLIKLSTLYKRCYLSMGRGALLVYASDVIERGVPTKINYRIKDEILDAFDTPSSHAKMTEMIDNYDQKTEGIMALITSCLNATYFITIKLKK